MMTEQRDWIAENYPTAIPLVDDGWTIDAALDHVQGVCDREICTGDHRGQHPLLDKIEAYAEEARAALLDEHEGNFRDATRSLYLAASELFAEVKSW